MAKSKQKPKAKAQALPQIIVPPICISVKNSDERTYGGTYGDVLHRRCTHDRRALADLLEEMARAIRHTEGDEIASATVFVLTRRAP